MLEVLKSLNGKFLDDKKLGTFMRDKFLTLGPKETALLIVDMQNDFCKPEGAFGRMGKDLRSVQEMVPRLRRLLEEVRKLGMLRVFIRTEHFPYTSSPYWKVRYDRATQVAVPGTWGAEFIDELKPEAGEPVVVKNRYSAFLDTNLQLILRCNRIKSLLITGAFTHVCIDTTARHAFMLDYQTVTVKDCVASYDAEKHLISLEVLDEFFGHVLSSDEVLKLLRP
jgi:ureidoacrylate peracid hydrolase